MQATSKQHAPQSTVRIRTQQQDDDTEPSRRCDNDKCEAHADPKKFTTCPTDDGSCCMSCGMVQLLDERDLCTQIETIRQVDERREMQYQSGRRYQAELSKNGKEKKVDPNVRLGQLNYTNKKLALQSMREAATLEVQEFDPRHVDESGKRVDPVKQLEAAKARALEEAADLDDDEIDRALGGGAAASAAACDTAPAAAAGGSAAIEAYMDEQIREARANKAKHALLLRQAVYAQTAEIVDAETGSSRTVTAAELESELLDKDDVKHDVERRFERVFVFVLRASFGKTEFRMCTASLDWYTRALQLLVDYKVKLRQLDPVHKRIVRDVELHSMHCIIIVSWTTVMPLTWNMVHSVMQQLSNEIDGERAAKKARISREQVVAAAAAASSASDVGVAAAAAADDDDEASDAKEIHSVRRLNKKLRYIVQLMDVQVDSMHLASRFVSILLSTCQQSSQTYKLQAQIKKAFACNAARQFEADVIAAACVSKFFAGVTLRPACQGSNPVMFVSSQTKPTVLKKRKTRASAIPDGNVYCKFRADWFSGLLNVKHDKVVECMKCFQKVQRFIDYDRPQ